MLKIHPYSKFSLFRGAPCINDDEARREENVLIGEPESGCSRPDTPEHGFIRVSMKSDTEQNVAVAKTGNFTTSLLYVCDIQPNYCASESTVFKECCGTLAHHTAPATEEKSR